MHIEATPNAQMLSTEDLTHLLLVCSCFVFAFSLNCALFFLLMLIVGSMPNELNQFNKSHLQNVSDKEMKSSEHSTIWYMLLACTLSVHIIWKMQFPQCIEIADLFGGHKQWHKK